jgi:hypothetical protein
MRNAVYVDVQVRENISSVPAQSQNIGRWSSIARKGKEESKQKRP